MPFIDPAPGTVKGSAQQERGDIRDYQGRKVGHWVHYTTEDHRRKGQVAFVDRGSRITLHDWPNAATTLAALQLAAEKWGRVVVRGNGRFKVECVRLAVMHGIQIANPELQDAIRTFRREIERTAAIRKTADHRQARKKELPAMTDTPRGSPSSGRGGYGC